MATTIAVITATNKKIGFIKMVAPSLTNAPPTVVIMLVNDLKPFVKSAGFKLPKFLANTDAFSLAPSKSKDARSLPI